MTEFPVAREIMLSKVKPLAPPFHRHIAKAALLGKPWQAGDRVVVYEIVATRPAGKVLVTEQTLLRFRS